MNALDRAFIKAYAKDASPTSAPRLANTVNEEVARATQPTAPYDTGPLYRVDYQPAAAAPVVPQPHQKFARTGNSLRSRYTTVQSPEVELEPPAPPQPVQRLMDEVRPMLREPAPFRELPLRQPAPLAPLPPPPLPPSPREPEPAPRSMRSPGLDLLARRLAGRNDFADDLPLMVEEPIVRPGPTSFVETVVADLSPNVTSPAVTPVTVAPMTTVSSFDFTPAPSILIFTPALDLAAHSAPIATPEPPPAEVKVEAQVEAKSEPTFRLDPPASAVLQGPHFKLKPQPEKPAEAAPTVAAPSIVVPPPAAHTETKSPAPAWEVDAFQWPEVCTKLLTDSHSYFAQAGAKLTAAVKDGLHTLAVAGSARGEGASTLALSLAKAAVQAGLNVALVDADFVDPQLAIRLGLDIDAGWQAAAHGHVPLHEAAVRSLSDKLTFFPLQKNAQLSLTDSWAVATLRKIQESFDLVLVDLGPLAAGDAPLFAKDEPAPFDAVVIVRDVRRTPLDHAQAVAGRLYAAGIEAVGIAENFVS